MSSGQGDPAADARTRAGYRFWSKDTIRFADLDRVGHVNNVAFAVYLETGRVDFLERTWPGSTAGTGIGWVIARLSVDYLAAAHYPGEVDIGTRVLRLGRSSLVVGQGLFAADRCFGTGETVLVWADTRAGGSLPLPDPMRAALERYRQGTIEEN